MIRKLTIIVILQVYLFSIVGVTLKFHDCDGESSLEVFGIVYGEVCGCDHDNNEHQPNCCHDEIKTIQADNHSKLIAKTFDLKSNQQLLYNQTFPFIFKGSYHDFYIQAIKEADHPPNINLPKYLSNRALII